MPSNPPPAPGQTVTNGTWGGQNQGLRAQLGFQRPIVVRPPTPPTQPPGYALGTAYIPQSGPERTPTSAPGYKRGTGMVPGRASGKVRTTATTMPTQSTPPSPSITPPGFAVGTPDVPSPFGSFPQFMPASKAAGPSLFDVGMPAGGPAAHGVSAFDTAQPAMPVAAPSGNNIRAMAPWMGQTAPAPTDPNQAPLPPDLGAVDFKSVLGAAMAPSNGDVTHVTPSGTLTKTPTDPNAVAALSTATGISPEHAHLALEPHAYNDQEWLQAVSHLPWRIGQQLWSMQHFLTPQQQFGQQLLNYHANTAAQLKNELDKVSEMNDKGALVPKKGVSQDLFNSALDAYSKHHQTYLDTWKALGLGAAFPYFMGQQNQ